MELEVDPRICPKSICMDPIGCQQVVNQSFPELSFDRTVSPGLDTNLRYFGNPTFQPSQLQSRWSRRMSIHPPERGLVQILYHSFQDDL